MSERSPRLTPTILAVAGMIPLAYLLGWLKTLYYFNTLGVDAAWIEQTTGERFVESWFVLQNTLFFALIWWIAIKSRWWPAVALAIVHALIPLASHYAFAFPQSGPAAFLIDYRHTVLKLLPFAALALLWWLRPHSREELKRAHWPHGLPAALLFALIVVSWSLSAAKHFGSYDANRALRWPERHLTAITIHGDEPVKDRLFLLHANRDSLVLWDRQATTEPRIVVVPRSEIDWLESTKEFSVQPGAQFL